MGYSDSFLTMGSCFSDHFGKFLSDHKFNTLVNPLGIVYNPISIAKILDQLVDPASEIKPNTLILHDGLWHSMMHHGQFSSSIKENLINELLNLSRAARRFMVNANFLCITLGSAHAYRHRGMGDIVANCHKIPGDQFEKILIGSEQIVKELGARFELLRSGNERLQIILTVSPVRYIRDGLVENNRSKANLLVAVHQLVQQFDFCHYFPAYEIVVDELRDYRYFTADLVHPNEVAVQHVLNKFVEHHFTDASKEQLRLIANLHRTLNHRTLHPESDSYQLFRSNLSKQIDALATKYPDLDFSKERTQFNQLPHSPR